MECSLVIDIREKEKLVSELYEKKLLFKCYINWANMAVSDRSYDNES
jgi:hypothetical protein